MDMTALLAEARKAAESAYAPYSKFRVGAALLCADGRVFTGVNVENRSFGLTMCAERNAVGAALTSGASRFTAVAIAAPDSPTPVGPCGACRQVLSEFMECSAPVIFGGTDGSVVNTTIGELIPYDSLHDLGS